MSVPEIADRERRELTERHQGAGTRRSKRQQALRWQRHDGRKRSGMAGYGRDLTAAALRERTDRAYRAKHRRQEQRSVRQPWNRVVSCMLTAEDTRPDVVTQRGA